MNNFLKALLIFLIPIFSTYAKQPKEVLIGTVDYLNNLKSVEYKIDGYNSVMDFSHTEACHIYFSNMDSKIGAYYHFKNSDSEQIYNGRKTVWIDHQKQQVITDEIASDVKGPLCLMNSFLTLKKFLPLLLDDQNVSINSLRDTVINNQDCFQIKVTDKGRWIGIGGEIKKLDNPEQERKYLLAVKKDNYQPVLFTQKFIGDNFFRSIYSEVKEPTHRSKAIWSESYFPDTYEFLTKKDFIERIKNNSNASIGRTALNWKLPSASKGSFELEKNRGKLVLIEFWFLSCRPCINAVPFLNILTQKYDTSRFEIVAIEFQNEIGTIEDYLHKRNLKIDYTILHNGLNVANEMEYRVLQPSF